LLAAHGFVAWARMPGAPVRNMLIAPNDTKHPVARPIAGVRAGRVLIDVLLPPSSGAVAVVIAYQPVKAFPITLTRHVAIPRVASIEFCLVEGENTQSGLQTCANGA
jgi:hypothetical protein